MSLDKLLRQDLRHTSPGKGKVEFPSTTGHRKNLGTRKNFIVRVKIKKKNLKQISGLNESMVQRIGQNLLIH